MIKNFSNNFFLCNNKSFNGEASFFGFFDSFSNKTVSGTLSGEVRNIILNFAKNYNQAENKINHKRVFNLNAVGVLIALKLSYIGYDLKQIRHPFHIVERSWIPFFLSTVIPICLGRLVCCVYFSYEYEVEIYLFLFSLVFTFVNLWFFSVQEEENRGFHTKKVQDNFRLGIILFILSEIMLFFSFFWSFFHFSFNPSVHSGNIWPPYDILIAFYDEIPLVNTIFLLTSGIPLSYVHGFLLGYEYTFLKKFWKQIFFSITLFSGFYKTKVLPNWKKNWSLLSFFERIYINFFLSNSKNVQSKKNNYFDNNAKFVVSSVFILDVILRGLVFLLCQYLEYFISLFTIADSIFGSIFFMITGLHGFHVIVGVSFLFFCFLFDLKPINSHPYWRHTVGFDGSVWYWHFVDVVWLYLFLFVYWWSFN